MSSRRRVVVWCRIRGMGSYGKSPRQYIAGRFPRAAEPRAEDAVFRMLSVTWEGTRIDYAEWVACQITEDFLWEGAQGFMSRASARGPARGRRRKQAEERLEEIEGSLRGFEWGLVHRIENSSAQARERKRRSMDRLEAARTAMTQRKDVDAEWVIKTFGSSVDGLKAGTILPDPSPMPPRRGSSNPEPQVNIGILQRLGFVKPGEMLGDQLGWPEAWIPEPGRRLFFLVDLRDRRRPCAVFVVCDRERQAHQLFALKPIKGRFGRQEYRFICPHTGRLSNAISYSEGVFLCSTLPIQPDRKTR